ncbi:MAG TPA: hypothetical protein VGA18_03210 [Rhodothermales bacterium]|jgi:hypothetical protein
MATTERRDKTFTFGGCTISKTSPAREKLTGQTKALNLVVSFEEALKLSLALEEAVRDINKLNRATKAGKAAAVNLTVYLDKDRLVVNRAKLT